MWEKIANGERSSISRVFLLLRRTPKWGRNMLKIYQAILIMSFGTILIGVITGLLLSTEGMLDAQTNLVMKNIRGDISDKEFEKRTDEINKEYREDAVTELEKVETLIEEAEDVFQMINSKTNMSLPSLDASGNFSEGVESIKNIE